MYELCLVLEQIINGFNDMPFSKRHPVIKRHEPVLHVGFDSMNESDAVIKQAVKQSWGDVPLVCKDLSVQVFGQYLPHFWVPVIHICSREAEGYNLTSVIAQQVELESMTPSHRALSVCGYPLEDLVGITPEVMAYRYHCTVHEAYAGTPPEGEKFEKECQLEEYPLFRLDKPIIGYRIREILLHASADAEEIIVFEIAVSTEMEQEKNGHDFAVGKGGFSVVVFPLIHSRKEVSLYFLLKMLVKLIQNAKNIYNFVFGNHKYCLCNLLFFRPKDTK